MREGLWLVGWGWSVLVSVFGFGVGGLALVGRRLCLQVRHGWVGVSQCWFVRWRWWVGVGRSWFVRDGLGLVGWPGLKLSGPILGLCWPIWGPSWSYGGPA